MPCWYQLLTLDDMKNAANVSGNLGRLEASGKALPRRARNSEVVTLGLSVR